MFSVGDRFVVRGIPRNKGRITAMTKHDYTVWWEHLGSSGTYPLTSLVKYDSLEVGPMLTDPLFSLDEIHGVLQGG